MSNSILTRLIPQPQKVSLAQGQFLWSENVQVTLCPRENSQKGAEGLLSACRERNLPPPSISQSSDVEPTGPAVLAGDPSFHFGVHQALKQAGLELGPDLGDDGYLLHVEPERIVIAANTDVGIYYGFQTLIQLLPEEGEGAIPSLTIEDWTTLKHRGVTMDFARGEVPTVETVKEFIPQISHYKVNMLVLYLENAFQFPSHPNLGAHRDRLTVDEAKELDEFAKQHHVMLVPCLDSPGHMERFLAEPELAHLAEGTEPENAKCVINLTHPETYPLLEALHSDMAKAFSAPYFVLAADEAIALGKGKSKPEADRFGADNLFVRHLKIMRGILAKHGKRCIIAGDPFEPDFFKAFGIENYGVKALEKLPRDLIVIPWHYNRVEHFPFGEILNDLGFEMHPWASFCNYNGVFPEIGTATENISTYIPFAHRLNALGAFCSGWGDRNTMREWNWPTLVFFSEYAWREDGRPTDELLPLSVERFFGPDTSELAETWRFLGDAARYFGWMVMGLDSPPFRAFFDPMEPRELMEEQKQLLKQFRNNAQKAREALDSTRDNVLHHPEVMDFLDFAMDQFDTMGDLVECRHLLVIEPSDEATEQLLSDALAAVKDLRERYRDLWLRARRPKGLEQNEQNFLRLEASLREALGS